MVTFWILLFCLEVLINCQRVQYPLHINNNDDSKPLSNVPLASIPFINYSTKLVAMPSFHIAPPTVLTAPKIKGSYLILASRIIRPGQVYYVSVNFKNIVPHFTILLIIQNGGNNLLNKTFALKAGKPVKVGLQIPDNLYFGDYKLVAKAKLNSGKFILLNETKLEYRNKEASVFINTDKAIYKRGQDVRFRIIVTDVNLKPYKGPINVSIYNPLQNKVKEWINEILKLGVLSDSFTISKDSAMGDWIISVQVKNFITKEIIKVGSDMNGIPKFEVIIECPKRSLLGNIFLPVVVKAKYPFGKPVSGSIELSLKNAITGEATVLPLMEFLKGETNLSIPLKYIKVPDYANENNFIVTANVTDALTGTFSLSSLPIILAQHSFIVEILGGPLAFKPGMKYTFWVRIRTYDNKFIQEDNALLTVFYTFDEINPSAWKNISFPVDSFGLVEVDLFPDSATQVIVVKAVYKDDTAFWRIDQKQYSPSLNFLQLYSDAPNYMVGDTVELSINSSEILNSVSLVVLSRGNIQIIGEVSMKKQKSARIQLSLTEAFIPQALVVVYYIRPDGEIVLDSTKFTVTGKLASGISINFSFQNGSLINSDNDTLEPGSEIIISGIGPPDSYVAISAIDQRSFLINPEEFPSLSKVYKDISSYEDSLSEDDRKYKSFRHPDQKFDSCLLLKKAGLAFITNGCTLSNQNTYFAEILDKDFLDQRQESSICSEETNQIKQPLKNIRSYFPETWLWLDIITGNDGRFGNLITIPDAITNWRLSAYFTNRELGLGQVEKVQQLHVRRTFFVDLHMSATVIRNQTVPFDVIIYFSGQNEIQVIVTLEKSNEFIFIDENLPTNEHWNKKIKIRAGRDTKITFNILPITIGDIFIKVSANSGNLSDSVIKVLSVNPEGHLKKVDNIIFINRLIFHKQPQVLKEVFVNLPAISIIPDTLKANVLLMGNPFGDPITDIVKMVRDPLHNNDIKQIFGNVQVFRYLIYTNQIHKHLNIKLESQVYRDFNFLLRNRNIDGSFYKSGKPLSSSTVYTALALQYFSEVSNHIWFDPDIITKTQNWFIRNQHNDGSFGWSDFSEQSFMDVKVNEGSVTAEVLIALINSKFPLGRPEILKASQFLEKNLNDCLDADVYAKYVYSLSLAKSQLLDAPLEKLQKMFNIDQLRNIQKLNKAELRIYSYLMLTYLVKNQIPKALKIAKFISQSIKIGSYISLEFSRAMYGLTRLAQVAYSPGTVAHVEISNNHNIQVMEIDTENANIVNDIEIPHLLNQSKISVKAQGTGSLLFEISWQFRESLPIEGYPVFKLDLQAKFNKSRSYFTINVCISYRDVKGSIGAVGVEIKLSYGMAIIGMQPLDLPNLIYLFEKYSSNNAVIKLSELSKNQTCLILNAVILDANQEINDISATVYTLNNIEFKETKNIRFTKKSLLEEET